MATPEKMVAAPISLDACPARLTVVEDKVRTPHDAVNLRHALCCEDLWEPQAARDGSVKNLPEHWRKSASSLQLEAGTNLKRCEE
jgi:hypothetical protein